MIDLSSFGLPFIRELLKVQLSDGKTLLHCIQFQKENMKFLFDKFGMDGSEDKLFIPILAD